MKNYYFLFVFCFILNTELLLGQTISNEGLIAHHTFIWPEQGSSEFIDLSGNGNSILSNDINPTNCPPENDRNENPSSYSVGASCGLSINSDYNSPSFENLSKFSCSFWVMYPNVGLSYNNSPIIQFVDENKISYEIRTKDADVILRSSNDQLLLGDINSSYPFPEQGWLHIAFSINEETETLRLYINGELKVEEQIFLFDIENPKVLLGNTYQPGLPSGPFCYDDFLILGRILDADEVEALYNNATPISTSLENVFLDENKINIFPNPTQNNEITINTDGLNKIFDLTIIDSQGGIVKRINNFSNNTLTTNNLNQGLYTLLFSFDKFNISKRLTVISD